MRITTFIGTVLIFGVAGASQASMVHYSGMGMHATVHITYDGHDHDYGAGQMMITIDNGRSLPAFCVDIDHTVRSNWTASMDSPLVLGDAGAMVAYLYNTYASTITTNNQAAGLQLALWEVMSDMGTSINLDAGRFRVSASEAARAQAQSYLSTLPEHYTDFSPPYVVMSGNDPRSQNLLVPEPGTLAILLLGAGLSCLRRRNA